MQKVHTIPWREKGIAFRVVSIGDPEDKPHLDFFQKCVKIAEEDLGEPIDFANAIIMGDAYANDILPAKEQLGFGLGVLYQEGKAFEIIDEHAIATGNLFDATKFLV